MTPDQALDFYRNSLDSEKWTETEYPDNQMLICPELFQRNLLPGTESLADRLRHPLDSN